MNKKLLLVKSFLVIVVLISAVKSMAYTSYSSVHGKKDNNYDVEFVLLSEQMKDRQSHDVNGQYNKLDADVVYNVTPKDDVRLFGSYVYLMNKGEEENDGYMELTEFMYRRNSLLSHHKHGVQMDLELKNYYVLDNDLRDRWGFGGAFIPQLVFSKRATSWLSLSGKVRRHVNMRKAGRAEIVKWENRAYFSPTLVFTRNFMFNTEFTYKHKRRVAKSRMFPEKSDQLELRPGFLYLLNRNVMAEVYSDTVLMKSHDKHAFSKTADDGMVYGVGLYVSAF